LNSTLNQFGPLIQSGCALVGGSVANGTATNATSSGNTTNGTSSGNTTTTGPAPSASQTSYGLAAQVSFLSLLAIALLL